MKKSFITLGPDKLKPADLALYCFQKRMNNLEIVMRSVH